jgi:hypothetical protein
MNFMVLLHFFLPPPHISLTCIFKLKGFLFVFLSFLVNFLQKLVAVTFLGLSFNHLSPPFQFPSDIIGVTASSERTVGESEGVTIDLLQSLTSTSSNFKVQSEAPLSVTSHGWMWRSLIKICFLFLDINRKNKEF